MMTLTQLKLGVVNQEFNFSQFEKVSILLLLKQVMEFYKVAKERTEKYLKKQTLG